MIWDTTLSKYKQTIYNQGAMQMPVYQPEIECASRSYLTAIQSARLIQCVNNAYNNIPFYKKKFDEMGLKPDDIHSIEDLHKLPFTLKTDIRDNYPFGMFAVDKSKLTRIHASSGTTGKPTVVGYTQKDIDVWSQAAARALAAAGATINDVIQVSYGYGLFTGGLGLHYGAEKLGAVALPMSTGNTKRQVQLIQDFESDFLCCTPSYAMYIGETMAKMGIDPKTLKLRGGVFGAEPWTDNMRKEIERLLDIEAHDIYGLSEISGPGVAYDCSCKNGLHICEDFFYPEIINPETGENLPDGEFGELVFTCIGKEALPLIRYRTRDIAALNHDKCECGRTVVRMTKPRGRSDDMLIIRGINVFPSQVEHVLLEMGVSPNYMIIVDRQNNLDIMRVQVEMNMNTFSDTIKDIEGMCAKISSALQSTLNVHADVELVEVGSLPRTEGKAKRVIDNRNIL